MKIGLILSKTPTYSETFFVSKIKGLQQSGFEVTLFVQQKTSDFNLCPVRLAPKVIKRNWIVQSIYAMAILFNLLRNPKRLKSFMNLEKKAKRSRKQSLKNIYNNAHILSAHVDWLHFGFATMALQSEHVAKVIGAKMAVSLRGFDMDVYPLKHPKCYELLWENVDKVHAISNYVLEKAFNLGLSNQKSHQIITPAIDSTKFKKGAFNKSKDLQIVTVARLHWIKGITYTLEALAILKNKGLVFNYTLIGSGPEYESIVYAIHQLGLTEVVHLVGEIAHDEIVGHLSRAEIYIQYSDSEGFCNAVLEAQAIGCLTVVSDGGALSENVIHKQTGWVVPKRNPKALAERIIKVINLSDNDKQVISSNAKNRVLESFNLEQQQKSFAKFYE